jgi:hypothetical protein
MEQVLPEQEVCQFRRRVYRATEHFITSVSREKYASSVCIHCLAQPSKTTCKTVEKVWDASEVFIGKRCKGRTIVLQQIVAGMADLLFHASYKVALIGIERCIMDV